MFETIEKYFREVLLLQPVHQLSPLEKVRVQHDAFRVISLAMGDVYEGGERYMEEIYSHVTSQIDGKPATPIVVLGEAGAQLLEKYLDEEEVQSSINKTP